MQFVNRDPLFRIIRITGPHHNLLGLELSPAPGEVELEVLNRGADAVTRLDGRRVAAQVLLGVEDACLELHARYDIAKIQYVADDTPPVEVYRFLAKQLVLWIDRAKASSSRDG